MTPRIRTQIERACTDLRRHARSLENPDEATSSDLEDMAVELGYIVEGLQEAAKELEYIEEHGEVAR